MAKSLSKFKKVDLIVVEGEKESKVTVIIKKAGLGKYKEITGAIGDLIKSLPKFLEEKGIEKPDEFIEKMTITDMLEVLPELLAFGMEQLVDIVAVITNLEPEFIKENVGLDEALEILEATLDVNNIAGAVEKGKNLAGRLGIQKDLAKK